MASSENATNFKSPKRKIFVSETASKYLTREQIAIKEHILSKIRKDGYDLERFFISGQAIGIAWSFQNVEAVMRKCVGFIAIAFPRWITKNECITSEYHHYEGAVANSLNLPMMIMSDERNERRGVFSEAGGKYILRIAKSASLSKLKKSDFNAQYASWMTEIEGRDDVFFGYCSKASSTAARICNFLRNELKLKVREWKTDFRPGRSILEEIDDAVAKCSGGIFLFTKDDQFVKGSVDDAAPRDNVILEAGVFIQAKGKNKVLIIRESGTKMPADLGGSIYLSLTNRARIAPVKAGIKKFILSGLSK